jgi:hypothetical protein
VVGREALIDAVWGAEAVVGANTLDAAIAPCGGDWPNWFPACGQSDQGTRVPDRRPR